MKNEKSLLKAVQEAYGLNTAIEAAEHVLRNYKEWDHKGGDRLFLAYCEEMVNEHRQPAPTKH